MSITQSSRAEVLTVDGIAENIASNYTELAAQFIDERAQKLYYASYSRGTYGRIMLPLLRKVYPSITWNGMSTSVGIAVTQKLEAMGYKFSADGISMKVSFTKVAA